MKEYQFKYNKTSQSRLVVLSTMLICVLTMVLATYLKASKNLTIIFSIAVVFGVFNLIKRKAIHDCTAKLTEDDVTFEFEDSTKRFAFAELISYKLYYGRNGPILYLKSIEENFKLFVSDAFCKTHDFSVFCDDTIAQLDQYRTKNPDAMLIHEKSLFGK
jgi:hypothetical protein